MGQLSMQCEALNATSVVLGEVGPQGSPALLKMLLLLGYLSIPFMCPIYQVDCTSLPTQTPQSSHPQGKLRDLVGLAQRAGLYGQEPADEELRATWLVLYPTACAPSWWRLAPWGLIPT